MRLDNNQQAFLALLRAGLWEQDVLLSQYGQVDFNIVYRLAEEQSVIGLVAAGIEHVVDTKVPKDEVLKFVGTALQIEQRNTALDHFIAELIAKLRGWNIYALLVKGQGIAQCYERPNWRASGDVDLIVSGSDYHKAGERLKAIALIKEDENKYTKHEAFFIGPWEVELHGSLRGVLWRKADLVIDEVQESIFSEGNVRSCMIGNAQIFLPKADEDVVFVFSHILQHFYKEGIGLRQICDWCRLLWLYRDTIDIRLLETRLRKMGVMKEWCAFSSLAIDYLGMPDKAMPFYSNENKWKSKAKYILGFVLKVGNFGHSIRTIVNPNTPVFCKKYNTALGIAKNSLRHFMLFPYNSLKTLIYQSIVGFKSILFGYNHD